jgi:ketosteroid isomerase-like protein
MLRQVILIVASLLSAGGCRLPGNKTAESSTAAAEIRALRTRSNEAIATRKLSGVTDIMLPDIVVIGGSGGVLMGRDSSQASFTRQFADPKFLGYTRTPTRVDVSTARPLAAEAGVWMGRWREADGFRQVRGTYLAMWRHTDDGWRIRSELFVTLACTGSSTCAPIR